MSKADWDSIKFMLRETQYSGLPVDRQLSFFVVVSSEDEELKK